MAKLKQMYKLNLHLRCGPVVIGDVLYPPGGLFGPRIQKDYQLVVIHRGSLELNLNDELISVAEHDGILLSPGHREHFRFAVECETHHSWIAIQPQAVPSSIRRELRRLRGPVPFFGRMANLLEIAREVALSPALNAKLQTEFYRGLAMAAVCEFAATVMSGRSISRIHAATLLRVEQFIAGHYADQIELRDMALAAGVSRQHLLRLCREEGKPTPTQQLYVKRLEIAADLLSHTGFSVAEVSEQTGFTNQFHFSRKFKQRYSQSPLGWRSRFWESHNL